jgi:hypothetical protein
MWPNNNHKFHICIGWPATVPLNWPYKSRAESQLTSFKSHLAKLRYIKPDLDSYLPRDISGISSLPSSRRISSSYPSRLYQNHSLPSDLLVVVFGCGTAPHSRTRLFLSCVPSRPACNCGILWSYNVGYRTCGESSSELLSEDIRAGD